MRWLLDTNVLIDAFAGRPDAARAMAAARSANLEWVGFSALTRLEALGFAGRTPADDQGLRALLAQFNEAQITPDIIDKAIRVRKAARIKTPDALIAATALHHQATLVTRNVADFRRVPGLMMLDSATF